MQHESSNQALLAWVWLVAARILATTPATKITSLTPSECMDLPDLELVAEEVHKAWIASKRAQGVSSRKAEDGEELMAPYERLSEKAKNLDRNTVRAVYAAIHKTSGKTSSEGAS